MLFQGIFDLDGTNQQEDIIIPLHTGDLERDILDMNEEVCPNLKKIKTAAMNSDMYQKRMKSKDTQELLNTLTETIGAAPDMQYNGNFIDCMMTSYCTDRPMPYLLLRDVDKNNMGSSLFNKFLEFVSCICFYQQSLRFLLKLPFLFEALFPLRTYVCVCLSAYIFCY